ISYGTAIITALTFLAKANVHGAYHLGGILLAYLYYRPPSHLLNANWWRWKVFERSRKRNRHRFTVINGKRGKGKVGDGSDGPTIH
ncbi:MAG: hypothetical protein HKP58_07490, partial [Desulfatitalea sp.]|nr:hypothetical protein [Desulfatitalea sp.]